MNQPIKKGDTVRLRPRTKRYKFPPNRQSYPNAIVEYVGPHGETLVSRDLQGMKWWNVEDLEKVP